MSAAVVTTERIKFGDGSARFVKAYEKKGRADSARPFFMPIFRVRV